MNKIKQNKTNKIPYIKILSSVAVVLIVFSIGVFEFKSNNLENSNISETKNVAISNNDLPRFKDINELKEILQENGTYNYKDARTKSAITLGVNETTQLENAEESKLDNTISDMGLENSDYSKTNVQVENVDEADIVKTDGNYIYYVTGNRVHIVDAKELKVISNIEIKEKIKDNLILEKFLLIIIN